MYIIYLTVALLIGALLSLVLGLFAAYKLTVIIPVDEEMWGGTGWLEDWDELSELTYEDLMK